MNVMRMTSKVLYCIELEFLLYHCIVIIYYENRKRLCLSGLFFCYWCHIILYHVSTCMLIFYSQKGEDEAMFVESEISPLVSYAGEVRVNDLTFYCSNKGVKLNSQGL